MKRILSIIALALTMASCTPTGSGDSVRAFTDTVYTPRYASGMSITRIPDAQSVLLSTTKPWQQADSSSIQHLLILRAGETAPSGFQGQVIDSAASRIICMSTTYIAMLDAIGKSDAIVGVSGLPFIMNTSVSENLDSRADVGYEGNVDYERLAALNPDIVLLYGITGPSVMESKLRDLNIPFVYIGEYTEESPLGKAEWTVFLGELTDNRTVAQNVFEQIAARYNQLRQPLPDEPVRVMLNMPYNSAWFMPSTTSYIAQLIHDAGGELVYTANSGLGSIPIDIESAYLLADSADVWINTGAATSLAQVLREVPKFADVKPMRTGRIYNNTRRMSPGGGNDYFESGVINPDLILEDLNAIFSNPNADSLNYYIKMR